MTKQLSEKEKYKLNELLQVNMISNTNNQNTDRKKMKSLKLINTDIFNNNNKEISFRNRPQLTFNSFYHNYTKNKNNNKSNRKISYKPRRLVKLSGGEIPLKFLGKATLDCTKTFYKVDQDDFEKKVASTGRKNKAINFLENEIDNLDNFAEYKAVSGVKLAQNSNNLYKLKKNIDLMDENRKRTYEDLFSKLLKLLDTQSQLFFSDDTDNKSNCSKTLSTFNTLSSQKSSNTLNNKTISTEKSNISTKMKKVINVCLDVGATFYKLLNLIFVELREKHNDNIRLFKKSNEQEIRFNQISKELDTLQKFHNRYDVSSKIYLQQGRENSIKHLKENFNKKENNYILNIYKLEDEIRNLTILLNKNKDYYNKLKETEKEIEKSKKQNEEMKSLYNREIHEKIIQNANEKDREEELNNKINELEDTIDKLKEEQEGNKRIEIETNAKIKKIRMIVNEKNENILMLNEELEWYIREYQKEKFNHNNTKTALQILENRIFKDEGTDGEKSKKEETDEKKENEQKINNISNKKGDRDNNKVVKLNLNVSMDSN